MSPAAELDVLLKVRTYITLNEDYHGFIKAQQSVAASNESMEIDHQS